MTRPNILLLTTDEQHCRTLGAYGNPEVRTPHLDQLGEEGVVFDRAYCANPLCSPSRASILTGQYPSRHGCWTVGVNLPSDAWSVADVLARSGYQTAALGKMHLQAAHPNEGNESAETFLRDRNPLDFDTWDGPYYGFQKACLSMGHACNEQNASLHYGKWLRERGVDIKRYWDDVRPGVRKEERWEDTLWDLPVEYHNSVWTGDIALDYLESAAQSDEPFFAWVSFQDPHDPYRVPNPYHDRYRPEDVLPIIRREGEMDDKPPHFQDWYHGRNMDHLCEMEGNTRSIPGGCEFYVRARDYPVQRHLIWNACVYGMVDLIDDQVGRILDRLETLGLAENTLVIFTSDHGDYMGNHFFWFKGPYHYEDVIRIPLMMRWPARMTGDRRCESVVSLVDLAPTLLDAAGVSPAEEVEGNSLVGVAAGEEKPARDYAIVENRTTRNGLYLVTVVKDRYKATFYVGEEYGELYDRDDDPDEFVNRWDDESCAKIRSELEEVFRQHQARVDLLPLRIGYA